MGQRIAIIVAGGSGKRMGSETPKQFMPLCGKPILAHTIEKFVGLADRIIVVVPSADASGFDLADAFPREINIEICHGGATRYESVKNALARIEAGPHVVAVHDGVRPLVGRALIEKAFAEAERHGTAIPYTTPVDTYRLDGRPVDRDKLMAIQTPQAFRFDVLSGAYATPDAGFTDDASVVETAGHTLHFIVGERGNIKITTPRDLEIAQALCE